MEVCGALQVVHAIEQRLHLLDRLPRVRINAWLKKLKEEVSSIDIAVAFKKPNVILTDDSSSL